jgi:hypothetical protein
MPAIVVSVLFVVSITFLRYVKTVGLEAVPPILRRWGVPASNYVAAAFIGTYGSVVIGVAIVSPLLLFSMLVKGNPGERLFSLLVDRPYFPLQTMVAVVLGYFVSERFKEGRPAYVWIWPVAQVSIVVALFHQFVPVQNYWADVWRTYFNWECGCSATLVQWTVMVPLYPSLAFSAAAFLRSRMRLRPMAKSSWRTSGGRYSN